MSACAIARPQLYAEEMSVEITLNRVDANFTRRLSKGCRRKRSCSWHLTHDHKHCIYPREDTSVRNQNSENMCCRGPRRVRSNALISEVKWPKIWKPCRQKRMREDLLALSSFDISRLFSPIMLADYSKTVMPRPQS